MLMKLPFSLISFIYDLKLETLNVSCASPSKKDDHRSQAPISLSKAAAEGLTCSLHPNVCTHRPADWSSCNEADVLWILCKSYESSL